MKKKFQICNLGDDTPQPTASPTAVSDDNSGKKWIIGGLLIVGAAAASILLIKKKEDQNKQKIKVMQIKKGAKPTFVNVGDCTFVDIAANITDTIRAETGVTSYDDVMLPALKIGGNWYNCTHANARKYFPAKYQKAMDTIMAKYGDALKNKTSIEEGIAKIDQMFDNETEYS